jgi:predicted phage terminase large subunit-like protein
MIPFQRFDQRDKHIKTITLGRVQLCGHQARDCFEGITIIALGLDWRDVLDCYLPKQFAHRSRRGATGILRPQAYPVSEIERLRRTQFSPPYELFYQQGLDSGASRAVQPGDFQSFQYYQLPPGPAVLSIDPGLGTGLTASRTVIQAWLSLNGRYYLADQYCEACDAEQFYRMFWKFVRRHRPGVALIEATANGPALYARVQNRARFEIRLITPRRASKAARLNAHVEKIQAKRIFLPQEAHWRLAFIDEIASYPGDFDDQLDAMTQYLDYMDSNPTITPAPPRGIVARPTIRYGSR